MAIRPPIDAVLFDLDGVLLDTEPLYTLATSEVVAPFGKTYDWSLKRRIMGRGQLEAARLIVSELDLPIAAEEYLIRTEAALERLFLAAPIMPGAPPLVAELLTTGLRLAIATSTDQRLFRIKVAPHTWLAPLGLVVCGDDPQVKSLKPEPDIFLVAAERLGVDPSRCVVIEDSPNGVLSGKRAGMQVIALPDPRVDDAAVLEADLVVKTLGEAGDALRRALRPN